MTTIPSTTSGGSSAVPTATKAVGAMDQNDFLRLMTTQLTTQDPFNPVDNTQMVAQMAQFSQVAGIAEMNQSLKALVAGMGGGAGRLNDAASWIGRSILAESNVAVPDASGGYAGEIALPDGADQLSINYVDANGTVVHSQTLGARSAGAASFAWNGKNEAGETVATGPLRIVVSASVKDQAITPAVATWTTVTGIQSPAVGGSTKLMTGLGLLAPEEAIRLA
ncbi:MAG TPA: flagellar hook capping FlgD N-terminal domain-containing protein [Allosphingosinicella sp.]